MNEDSNRSREEGIPTPIPIPEPSASSGSSVIGGVLSFCGLILLAFIVRLAVPQEDNAIELGILLIAVGFAQVWLILHLLKSIRK